MSEAENLVKRHREAQELADGGLQLLCNSHMGHARLLLLPLHPANLPFVLQKFILHMGFLIEACCLPYGPVLRMLVKGDVGTCLEGSRGLFA